MKKAVSLLSSLLVAVSGAAIFAMSASAASTHPAGVGAIRDGVATAQGWTADEAAAITRKYQEAYQHQLELGFNLGSPASGDQVHDWANPTDTYYSQNYSGGDSTANLWGIDKLALLMMKDKDSPVFAIKGQTLTYWGENGLTTYGAPTSDEFVLDGKTYQRFDYAYMVDGLKVELTDASVKDLVIPPSARGAAYNKVGVSLTMDIVGNVGPIWGGDWGWASGQVPTYGDALTAADVQALFTAEYMAQLSAGFNPGVSMIHDPINNPDIVDPGPHKALAGYVHAWANGEGDNFLCQNFYLGDSTANAAGAKNGAILFLGAPLGMEDADTKVFTVKNDMMEAYGENGITVYGAPTSNEFTFKGETYQRFTYGFLKIDADGVASGLTEEEAEEISLVIPKAALGVGYTGDDVQYGEPEPQPSETTKPADPTKPSPGTSDTGIVLPVAVLLLAGASAAVALKLRKTK